MLNEHRTESSIFLLSGKAVAVSLVLADTEGLAKNQSQAFKWQFSSVEDEDTKNTSRIWVMLQRYFHFQWNMSAKVTFLLQVGGECVNSSSRITSYSFGLSCQLCRQSEGSLQYCMRTCLTGYKVISSWEGFGFCLVLSNHFPLSPELWKMVTPPQKYQLWTWMTWSAYGRERGREQW